MLSPLFLVNKLLESPMSPITYSRLSLTYKSLYLAFLCLYFFFSFEGDSKKKKKMESPLVIRIDKNEFKPGRSITQDGGAGEIPSNQFRRDK